MDNRVVVITGGSGTLGKAIAQGLIEQGAIVYILSRNADKAQEVVKDLSKITMNIFAIQCDVLSSTSVENAFSTIIENEGRIDVLINGAGGNRKGATIGTNENIYDVSIDEIKQVTDLNFTGTLIPSVVCSKYMSQQKSGGSIINISSMADQAPLTRVVAYSASKAAVNNFTKWMAVEMASKHGEKIRVNGIAPGFFIAEQNRSLLLKDDGTYTERGKTIISQTPFKRFGNPEEIVSTILWLCDDKSSFITGVIVPIDGGFSAFSGV